MNYPVPHNTRIILTIYEQKAMDAACRANNSVPNTKAWNWAMDDLVRHVALICSTLTAGAGYSIKRATRHVKND